MTICRSYISKTVMHIAKTTRKCITMIDTTPDMRSQRGQRVEERRDTGTRMHRSEHCMLNWKQIMFDRILLQRCSINDINISFFVFYLLLF